MVVIGGMLGGCAQKPGVAATLTEVSCEKGAGPPVSQVTDGQVRWGCAVGPLVRGDSWTISTADVADLRAAWNPGLAYMMGAPADLNGSDAVLVLLPVKIVVVVTDKMGMAPSDADAAAWLEVQGLDDNHAMRLVAKYALALTTPDQQQLGVLYEKLDTAIAGMEIVVNPRFGTFNPNEGLVPPAWARTAVPAGW